MRALPCPGDFVQIEAGAPDLPPVVVKWSLFTALVGLETAWGRPLILVGGWRTRAYNDGVKGLQNSKHLDGMAVDVRTRDYTEHQKAALAAICSLHGLEAVNGGDHLHLEIP